MSNFETIISSFELQGGWCTQLGSPFTGELFRRFVADLRDGGPVAALIGDWPGHPLVDALGLRLAGALHAAALSARDRELVTPYAEAPSRWDMDALWPVACAFLEREEEWVRAFLRNPPQTNETRRTIALLPAFLALARLGPLHTLEIGASAGLNLMWDRFRYETASWRWNESGAPRIDTEWRGPPPAHLDARLRVASRAACDQQPLDVRDADHMLRLKSYVWPDQAQRLERLDGAIALARSADVRVERADAGAWLTERLAAPLPEGVTVLYHSVMWQYPPQSTRDAVTRAVDGAAARADDAHRVAWLRYEPNGILGTPGPVEEMAVDLQVWPGGERKVLVQTDGHARWVQMATTA